jgi:hypothetical protein
VELEMCFVEEKVKNFGKEFHLLTYTF